MILRDEYSKLIVKFSLLMIIFLSALPTLSLPHLCINNPDFIIVKKVKVTYLTWVVYKSPHLVLMERHFQQSPRCVPLPPQLSSLG